MSKKAESVIRLAVAIPTFNESKNITKLTQQIKAVVANIGVPTTLLIIDDSSPDGTGEIADKLAKANKSKTFTVRVLHRTEKDGFGRAYVAGFKELLKDDFTHILQMDADLSHNPKYIPQFIKAAASGSDFVVGARYIKGGGTPDWTWNRKLLSRFGNVYARAFLGNSVHDYTGGFNMYTVSLLKGIKLSTLQAGGYGFLIELKYRALKKAKQITEVPIIFMDRTHGVSKMPKSTIVKNLILVPKLKKENK